SLFPAPSYPPPPLRWPAHSAPRPDGPRLAPPATRSPAPPPPPACENASSPSAPAERRAENTLPRKNIAYPDPAPTARIPLRPTTPRYASAIAAPPPDGSAALDVPPRDSTAQNAFPAAPSRSIRPAAPAHVPD